MKPTCLLVASIFLFGTVLHGQNKTLGIGVTVPNPHAVLHVESPSYDQGFIMPKLTTVQRTAMTSLPLAATDTGLMVYDTDLNGIYIWNGNSWVSSAKLPFPINENFANSVTGTSMLRFVNSGTATGNFGVAAFENTNPNNGFSAIYGSTTSATNGVADFVINNPANNNDGIGVTTNGLGTAGRFNVSNSANANPAVYATTNAGTTAMAIRGDINNATNASAAVYGSTNGTGVGLYGISTGSGAAIQGYTATALAAVYGKHDGPTNGFGGLFEIMNSSNIYEAIKGTTFGTGSAALFNIDNTANNTPAVRTITNGTSHAIHAETTNTVNGTSAAIHATSNSLTAFGGNFRNTNTSSTGGALYLVTYGTGSTTVINHRGSAGDILEMQNLDSKVARIDKTGKGFFNGGTQTGGADVAELFDVEGDKQNYEPGDVLIISESTNRTLEKSNSPHSTKIIGVYATKPGVILTEKGLDENTSQLVPLGVIGVIPTKVCNENGPVNRGDLLVTSSRKGYAMKASLITINGVSFYPSGIILGKALEDLTGEAGKINVFVNVK